MAVDRYTSILAMRLQMEQQQQQQEKAEALQREQMNDQREMQALTQIVQSGRDYFNAMKAADDRDLKLAHMRHQQYLDLQKEARENEQHRADQMARVNQLEWKEKKTDVRAGEKRAFDTEERLAEEEESRAKAGRKREFDKLEREADELFKADQKRKDRRAAQKRADTMTLQKKQAAEDKKKQPNYAEKQRLVQNFEDDINAAKASIEKRLKAISTFEGARAAGVERDDMAAESAKLERLMLEIDDSFLYPAHDAQELSLLKLQRKLKKLRADITTYKRMNFHWLIKEGQEETTPGVQRPTGVRRPTKALSDFVKKNRKNP